MTTENLQFGRENTGFAVLAMNTSTPQEQPVVVSVFLGEKYAMNYMIQMQSQNKNKNIVFFVREVQITGISLK